MRKLLPFLIALFLITPALAQDEIAAPTEAQATEQTPPADAPETPALPKAPEYEEMPQVELRILDKVRAESRTYTLNVGRTVAYNNLRIRPRSCRKSSPLDDPENASFLQIWEIKPDSDSVWVFSGWMFASSPSLSAMDHPVFDVTVLNCLDPNAKPAEAPKAEEPQDEDAKTESQSDSTDEEPVDTEDTESTKETPEAESAPSSAE